MTTEIERVSLRYNAPVFVTINLKTGDVERVYLDDEGIVFDDDIPLVCMDADEWDIEDRLSVAEVAAVRQRALTIAEDVDWTSTDNRCQVWRGAYGGPGNILEVLAAVTDHFALMVQHFPKALERTGVSDSELRAVQLFLHDSKVWESEHPDPTDAMDDEQMREHNDRMENDRGYRDVIHYERN